MFFGLVHRFVFSKYSTVIGGKFNCVDNPALDRTNFCPKLLNSYKSQNLIKLCQTFDLHDALRMINATLAQFTWHGPAVASHLGRFYVTASVKPEFAMQNVYLSLIIVL